MDFITRLLLLGLCAGTACEPRDASAVYARHFARRYEPYVFAAFPLHAPVPVLRVLSRAPLPAPSAPRPARGPTQHYAHPDLQYADSGPQYPRPTQRYAESARPYAPDDLDYEASSYDLGREREYERPSGYHKARRQVAPRDYEYVTEYASYAPQYRPLPQLTYAIAPYEPVAYSATQEAAPTVLYARPSPTGGFTYRRVPSAPAPAPAPAPPAQKKAPTPHKGKEKEKDPPYIIKIHKYRIVKDDLI